MNFSQRNGLEPAVKPLLTHSISPELRIQLWNVLVARLFGKLGSNMSGNIIQEYHVFITLWRHYFKLPMDDYERQLAARREWYRDIFDAMEWNQVYDFVEFIAARMVPYDASVFVADVNEALAAEHSAYRFVANKMVCIAESLAAKNLASAVDDTKRYAFLEAEEHLNAAIAFLGQRETPNFAQAIACAQKAFESALGAAEKLGPLQSSLREAHEGALTEDGHKKTVFPVDEKAYSILLQRAKQALLEINMHRKMGTAHQNEDSPTLANPDAKPDEKKEPTRANCEFFVGHAGLWVRYLIAGAVENGFLLEIPHQELKPTNPDPWGEKRRIEQPR